MQTIKDALAWGTANTKEVNLKFAPAPAITPGTKAQASTLVVALGKRSYYAQVDPGQQKACACAKEAMSLSLLAHDAQEGISGHRSIV